MPYLSKIRTLSIITVQSQATDLNTVDSELDQLNEFKRGLLQKMFV